MILSGESVITTDALPESVFHALDGFALHPLGLTDGEVWLCWCRDIRPRGLRARCPISSTGAEMSFRGKFKKSAEFLNFQQMFYFSSGRFGFPLENLFSRRFFNFPAEL
jgi:hypothetical protein